MPVYGLFRVIWVYHPQYLAEIKGNPLFLALIFEKGNETAIR